MAKKEVYYATGKRKTSVARVYMTKGKGVFTINKKPTICGFFFVNGLCRILTF